MINTLEKVNEIVLEQVPDLTVQLGPTHRLNQDLGIDSLTFVDILVKVEKIFGIEITDDELGTVQSVQDILELIQRKQ
ncbi:acyl carrier protein [Micromonospora cathayae]|uniref:Acyl carrier protein n=1 Tax=Micromonospora cathayae TaxID=3028804 RepID=A0ABY7ZMY5_9ACTN|nr:phosphopantetheine-binding protein [Micromonospora sp. HUAS 3]WDZ83438.1 phosphopantetheine-binding protein [Micromonospora sp. HUAS 3]